MTDDAPRPKKTRTKRRSPPASTGWEIEFDEDPETSAYRDASGTAVVDPAAVATRLLLKRAFAEAGLSPFDPRGGGTICMIVVPSTFWSALVLGEWRDRCLGGVPGIDGGGGRQGDAKWSYWVPVSEPGRSFRRDGNEGFSWSIAHGHHCIGITPDVTWLPQDLVDVVDIQMTLPAMTPTDLTDVATALSGSRPTRSVSVEEADRLTPRLLRLARRQTQGADDYVDRLRHLLALEREREGQRTQIPVSTTSIRDTPTLDRLHGMDEAVRWGMSVARDLDAYRAGTIPWEAVDRGCLVSGPPGCGKTAFARALAATCDVPLVAGSYGEWHGSGSAHQGDLLKAMRKTFETARNRTPSIVFIDEIDSFPNRSTLTHRWADWEIQVVNALLAEIDGVQGREGVIVIGACNHPEKLDPALVRSGRLDRHIRIGLPGRRDLERILREHLGSDLQGESLSAAALAALGSSGADCERFVRGARRRQRQAARKMVLDDLLAEIMGEERTTDSLTVAAIHEAGHALAYCVLRPGTLVATSLARRGDAEGTTVTTGLEAMFVAEDGHELMTAVLAGRAAEAVAFGQVSSGSGGDVTSDLAHATTLAGMLITAFGFDRSHGLVWSGEPDPGTMRKFLAADLTLRPQVRFMLDAAYDAALALVRSHRSALEALADALLERRALDGEEVTAIVAANPPAAEPVP
ncbi:AAA family ATPase [Jatrophihabitans endophyticus]|uniref:AAA family ATPase n=1 Tax=Jatrophihabitans endophyticus TaxID=1206085 RepID=UPI0019EDA505|nr:AAA family ATPase [Jatrophihabitans endophyticus]MBE7189933.1 AAA family ATPase [Jatrophihabitans endophyticus]